MSNPVFRTVTKTENSPYPYYIVAGFWLASSLLLRIHRLSILLILGAASIVIYLVAKRKFPPKTIVTKEVYIEPAMSGIRDVDAILQNGYDSIKRIGELNDLIPHERLSYLLDRLEILSGSIFNHIAEHPEKVSQIRRFVNYYLPSTIKMMETWHDMSTKGIQAENIKSSMERIENVMETMVKVYEQQLDTLYFHTALDVSAEIDVLEKMFAQEGIYE